MYGIINLYSLMLQDLYIIKKSFQNTVAYTSNITKNYKITLSAHLKPCTQNNLFFMSKLRHK